MDEVTSAYRFHREYVWIRDKAVASSPLRLEKRVGVTRHYGLPDFRLLWSGIRIVGIHPRPKGVEFLLEFSKFLANRFRHDAGCLDAFEDAMGALPINKNGLLVVRSLDSLDEAYVDTYIQVGMRLLVEEIRFRHGTKAGG